MTSTGTASRTALDRLDRANRNVTIIIVTAAIIEFVLLVLVLLNINFGDPLHRVVFLLATLTYFTLGLGLVAVAAHMTRVQERLLNALEILRDTPRG